MALDAIVSLVSLLGPKLIDVVKGLFSRKNTPEQTLATLAQTNPEALAKYVEAQASLVKAENESVNADIAGSISMWVSNVRAMIRPVITVLSAAYIIYAGLKGLTIAENTRYVFESVIGSWFGSRLSR